MSGGDELQERVDRDKLWAQGGTRRDIEAGTQDEVGGEIEAEEDLART